MPIGTAISRFRARFDPDTQMEDRAAARLDANLAQLHTVDPDARQIPAGAFTRSRHDRRARLQLAEQIQAYATAKNTQDRMDLYGQLFAGLEG